MKDVKLICDSCGEEDHGSENHFDLPLGWIVLGFHSQRFAAYDDWRVTHHFCSRECMDKAVKVSTQQGGDRE